MAKKIVLPSTESKIEIGTLSREISSILGLDTHGHTILLGTDRIKYMAKHREDFATENDYKQAVLLIPDIVMDPILWDYIRRGTAFSSSSV